MQWTVIITLVFALLVGIFAVQNHTSITLKFFSYEFDTSLVVVVLGGVALGAMTLGILGLISKVKSKLQIRTLKGKIKSLEKDLTNLRAEKDDLITENNDLAVDLARLEGAQEEILAQEALQVKHERVIEITPEKKDSLEEEKYSSED